MLQLRVKNIPTLIAVALVKSSCSLLEIDSIRLQKTKAGGQGSMQRGSINYTEKKERQIATTQRKKKVRRR